MLAWLLAHQGGWDEILMVVGPLALLWFLLRKAKSRADAMDGETPDQPTSGVVTEREPPTPPAS
jgi:hypothetical protein